VMISSKGTKEEFDLGVSLLAVLKGAAVVETVVGLLWCGTGWGKGELLVGGTILVKVLNDFGDGQG